MRQLDSAGALGPSRGAVKPALLLLLSLAQRFRREGNVTSLVAVAASLDQLEALPW